MRLSVHHATTYAFDQPAEQTVQALRLTPQPYAGLAIRGWNVTAAEHRGALPSFHDGYGNRVHLLTKRGAHTRISIVVQGEVDTTDTGGVVQGGEETLPPSFWLRSTEQTAPDTAIAALAEAGLAGVCTRGTDGAPTASLAAQEQAFAEVTAQILARVTYQTGVTDSTTTAAAALANGAGVCQDHAHILIACARLRGWPARYVSGYLWPGSNGRDEPASHAWAEVWLGDPHGGGEWHGFDPANNQRPGERYLRLAVGLDYAETAPVRGVRRGGGTEELVVNVRVDALLDAQ